MSADKKVVEALEHIKQAEKHLKTGFFSKWKPDYDSAAYEYTKAATAYKNAKSLEKTKDCYIKAAECYVNIKVLFQAAKCYEQAALVCRDQDDLIGTATYIDKSADLFMEQGTPDTAALTLDRGAKIMENKYPEKAVEMYNKAFEYASNEDKFGQASEYIGKAARLYTKLKQFDSAASCVQKEIEMNTALNNFPQVCRLTVARVLLLISFGDVVAARTAYQDTLNCDAFHGTEESQNISHLLDAIEDGDSDGVTSCLNRHMFKQIDNEYAKLARELKVNELSSGKHSSWDTTAAVATGEDEDESDGYGDDLK